MTARKEIERARLWRESNETSQRLGAVGDSRINREAGGGGRGGVSRGGPQNSFTPPAPPPPCCLFWKRQRARSYGRPLHPCARASCARSRMIADARPRWTRGNAAHVAVSCASSPLNG